MQALLKSPRLGNAKRERMLMVV